MKPCFSCIHISAGPSDSSSDPALRIPALSKCRRIRFRHWEAGLSAECRGTRRLNSTTATTPEDSEVVAVVEFNLRIPRHSADNPASQCRKRIRLHFDSAGIRKAGSLDESEGPADNSIPEKQGFIPIRQVCHHVSPRKQFSEGDPRHHGK